MAIVDAPWRSRPAVAFLVVTFLTMVVFTGISRNRKIPQLKERIEGSVEEGPLWIDISYVEGATEEGAVCLDGTPPAYHLHRGSGSGSKNWLVFLEGGGWCRDEAQCLSRSMTQLGSSLYMEKQMPFSGILSNSARNNPDFYNWNRVKVRYCDGASFAGDVNETKTPMYRGQRVWRAVIKELLSQGMNQANKALLAGCSAGGLATILHCDNFKSMVSRKTSTKCLTDAGFFLDAQDVHGNFTFRSFYKDVLELQNVKQVLPKACTSKHGDKCLFPQYLVPHVKSPLFIVNPAYDTWQVQNILAPNSGEWDSCKQRLPHCSRPQLKTMHEYRGTLLETLKFARNKKDWDLFIDSCFAHCQTEHDRTWVDTKIGDKTLRDAVGDWYFNRNQVKLAEDCVFPCNPTCLPWKRKLYKVTRRRS